MAVLPIITGSDQAVLRTKTEPVTQVSKEIKKLLKDMRKTVQKADGAGLAAPQVGVSKRVCLALINKKITALINPQITWRSNEQITAEEGCLSLPGIWLQVPRAKAITLTYLDESGEEQERRLEEWDARVAQHEIDHLDGVLIVDYQNPASSQTPKSVASA